ncbi:MAG: recombination mediator RecR [Natronospirillum sp.]
MHVLDDLVAALRTLPTIGPKTARRLALHVLQRDRPAADQLATALQAALASLKPCAQCRQLSVTPLCAVCADTDRDQGLVCVVETLDDLYQIEQTGVFTGRYFLLNGHLSPLDGIGPEELGIPDLLAQVTGQATGDYPAQPVRELLLALNPQVEGQATTQYITDQIDLMPQSVTLSTLAQGVPMGRDINRLDPATLSMAVNQRVPRAGHKHLDQEGTS